MLETPHAALGAAIAVHVGNPALALPLALLSHFSLESVPHWNPHTYTEVTTKGKLSGNSIVIIIGDVLLALGVGFWIALRQLPNVERAGLVILACFLAVLPDLVEAPFFFLGTKHRWLVKLVHFQRSLQVDVSPFPGLLVQAIVVLILVNWAIH